MKQPIRRAVAGLILLLLLSATAGVAQSLEDQHGVEHSIDPPLSGYSVIEFAASWCIPCWKALPRFQELADEHPDLRILVVSVDKDDAGRQELVDGLKLSLPVVLDSEHVWVERLGPEVMPTTLVLDPEGREVYRHRGAGKDAWEELVAFLKEVGAIS